MGVEDHSDGLAALNRVAENAAQTVGFAPEERPFHAHLTLSRIRPPEDVWTWLEYEPVFPRPVPVEAMTVFETIAGGGGARYRVRDRIEL
jgi:2'-5' RNA ligase